jgi:hypothetical protein
LKWDTPFCHNKAVSIGCFQVQSVEEIQLFRLLSGEGCLGGRADAGDVLLNAFE